MTGPRVEPKQQPLPFSPEAFDASQPTGLTRGLSPDEFDKAQGMTPMQLKAWKLPPLDDYGSTFAIAPRDVTVTRNTPRTKGKTSAEWARELTGGQAVVEHLAGPLIDHPWMSAGAIGASMIPFVGPYVSLAMAGDITSNIALYGYQKHLEEQATPGARKIMEADPQRISGEAAIAQGIMLGLIGAHAATRPFKTDPLADMEITGVRPPHVQQLPPRTLTPAGDVSDMEIPVGTNKFAGDLARGASEADAYARVGNQPARPKGFEPTAGTSRAGAGAKPVEGLQVPETATAGKVKPLETLPANATLEEKAAYNEAVRIYEAERLAQEEADLSASRQADADKIAQADAMRPRRRAKAFVESEQGAEALGTAAAQHGLPADASPFIPNTPQDVAWKSGHEAVTSGEPAMTATGEAPAGFQPSEPLPSYPEGFAMGGPESRIPAASEVPKVARGTEPEFDPFAEQPSRSDVVKADQLAPVEGTGETVTRGLSRGVAEKAVENRLGDLIGDLPEYQRVSMADQSRQANDLLTSDPTLARRIALGEEVAPTGILPEAVFVAVENKAVVDGDITTIRDLANSKLATEATTMGQRIRALGERDPDSPVNAIRAVERRITEGRNVEKPTLKTVKEIEEHFKGMKVAEKAWNDFIDGMRC